MPRYALIKAGTVENVIVADSPPTIPGSTVVALTAAQVVSPGDGYNGSVFTAAVPSPREQLRRVAPDNIRQSYTTLRQWSADAAATYAAATSGNRALTPAEQREVIRRLGIFFDRFADYLLTQDLDA